MYGSGLISLPIMEKVIMYGEEAQQSVHQPGLTLSAPCVRNKEIFGRRDGIRTHDPYVPNVVLYQAELLSDVVHYIKSFKKNQALFCIQKLPHSETGEFYLSTHIISE